MSLLQKEKTDFEQLMSDREFKETDSDVWVKYPENVTLTVYKISDGTYTLTKEEEDNIDHYHTKNRLDLVELKSFLEHWDY